jgi:FdhE protein
VTPRERSEALRREQPSLAPWLALVEIALDASAEPAWEAAARGAALRDGTPALAGAHLRVEGHAVGRLVDRLLSAASEDVRAAARGADPASWLAAGFGGASIAPELAPIADLVALPLFLACGKQLKDRGEGWLEGSCPICGAWPTLAELRGLDRARRLRCGRCGADWGLAPLLCPFCENDDHEKLRSLVPETGGDSRRVDVCLECQGYVKTVAQLAAIRPAMLPLEDLASVDLDVVAMDRGYSRPEPRAPLGARALLER